MTNCKRNPQRYVENIRETQTNEKNGMWRGESVTRRPLHQWIKRRLKRPDLCQQCEKAPVIDLVNISGQYKRDITDWQWLCRRCHMVSDGRMGVLKQYSIENWKKNGRYWGRNKYLGQL